MLQYEYIYIGAHNLVQSNDRMRANFCTNPNNCIQYVIYQLYGYLSYSLLIIDSSN